MDLPSLSGQTKISPLVAGELLVWWHHHEGDGDGDGDGVISLCLWGISPTDFASLTHHYASFHNNVPRHRLSMCYNPQALVLVQTP